MWIQIILGFGRQIVCVHLKEMDCILLSCHFLGYVVIWIICKLQLCVSFEQNSCALSQKVWEMILLTYSSSVSCHMFLQPASYQIKIMSSFRGQGTKDRFLCLPAKMPHRVKETIPLSYFTAFWLSMTLSHSIDYFGIWSTIQYFNTAIWQENTHQQWAERSCSL